MKNFQDKIEDREVIYIEDLVLVKNTKDSTYNDKEDKNVEKGGYIGTTMGKFNTMQYEIYTKEGKKVGLADYNTGKIIAWNSKYERNKNLNVKQLIKEQVRKDKERKKIEETSTFDATNKKAQKNDKAREVNNEKPKSKNIEQEKKKDTFTKEKIESYNNVKIKDFAFVADLINPNEYNIYDTYFINKDGNFQMYAQDLKTGEYEKIDEYTRKKNKIGEIDTIEKSRNEEKIGMGQEVTYLNRNGERVEVDFQQISTGEIEARVTSMERKGDESGDIDKDGTIEGIKIATDRDPNNVKVEKFDNVENDINQEKEGNNIQTNEINEGPLTDEQMKELIGQADLEPKDEAEVIKEISSRFASENPTENELNEIIGKYEHEKDDDEERLEPGYTRDKNGVLRFRGMPIE